MLRTISFVSILAALAFAAPAQAVTAKQKAETCKFGADDQKLAGAARTSFMSKCMASEGAPKRAAKKPAAPAPQ
jgi:hypothetical protein